LTRAEPWRKLDKKKEKKSNYGRKLHGGKAMNDHSGLQMKGLKEKKVCHLT